MGDGCRALKVAFAETEVLNEPYTLHPKPTPEPYTQKRV